MSAWHGIYADVLRQRFSALVAYGVALTGDRDAGLELAQRALESVFAKARAPHGVAAAEGAVRREMVKLAIMPDAGAGSDPDAPGGTRAGLGAGGDIEPDVAGTTDSLDSLSRLNRAAATLLALDGLDEPAIRRELGRRWPAAPISDAHAHELRAIFAAESARPASPAGGATGAIAASRGVRREALVRRGVLTGTAAVAVVALGFGAAQAIDLTGFSADPAPSPSAQIITVTWDDGAELDPILEGLALPQCGEVWMPGPQSVNGITPIVTVRDDPWEEERPAWAIEQAYDFGDQERVPFLHTAGIIVVTRDDHVVFTPTRWVESLAEMSVQYVTPLGRDYAGGEWMDATRLCDAQDAWDEEFGNVDWENLAEDELAKREAAWVAYRDRWSQFEPGTYRFYAVTPVMFGEQAALAQVLTELGLPSLDYLRWNLAGTVLAEDSRIAPFCGAKADEYGYVENRCDPPPSVLNEVLTREVDPATIRDWPPGVGISEPVVIVVP